MDNIVADGKLGEVLDFSSLIGWFFLSLSLLFCAEHIPFRDHDKFQQGVFKTAVEVSIGDKDFTGADLVGGFFVSKCAGVLSESFRI